MAAKSPAPSSALKPKKEEPPPMLLPEQTIAAESGKSYLVEKILGKGGFGEVYLVSSLNDPNQKFAMKVEPNEHKLKQMLRLKVEIHVFQAIAKASYKNAYAERYFVRMHDKGITKVFKYYVMDLIWMSLSDVVYKICNDKLRPSSLIRIAQQTLHSLHCLHMIGFLHRDIKAANYAVGRPPNDEIIYLLDFGISRPYRDPDGKVKVAREKVAFLGTPRYASIRCLENKEQCRKDDLEVWIYMMLELYDKNNIVWWREPHRAVILKMKKDLMNDAGCYFAFQRKLKIKIPEDFWKIINLVRLMSYYDEPDYIRIEMFLDEIVNKENINILLPFEWAGKKPESPEKPKKEEIKKDLKIAKNVEKTTEKRMKTSKEKMESKEKLDLEEEDLKRMENMLAELKMEKLRRSREKTEKDDDVTF